MRWDNSAASSGVDPPSQCPEKDTEAQNFWSAVLIPQMRVA